MSIDISAAKRTAIFQTIGNKNQAIRDLEREKDRYVRNWSGAQNGYNSLIENQAAIESGLQDLQTVRNQSTDPKLIADIDLVIKRYQWNNSVSECEHRIAMNQSYVELMDDKISALQSEIDNLKAAFGITD